MNALHKVSVPAWPAHASPATKVCWAVWKTPCRSVPCACTSPGTQEQGLCLIMAWLSMAMEENVKDEPHLGKQSQTNSISLGAAHTTNRMDLWPRASSDATGTAQAPCRKRLHGGLSPLSMNKCGARQSLASCVCMGESALCFCFPFPWGLCKQRGWVRPRKSWYAYECTGLVNNQWGYIWNSAWCYFLFARANSILSAA